MLKGKLIVMEGACDGIGKSTQFKLLKSRLENDGEIIFNCHFPRYDTETGQAVQAYLRGDYGNPKDCDPLFVHDLFARDRAAFWDERKDIDDSNIIYLLDRYVTSSFIYQSASIEDIEERMKLIRKMENREYNELGVRRPDKVLFLDAPFNLITDIRSKRKSNDGVPNDIHERDLDFLMKVYNNSHLVAEMFGFERIDCTDGNGNLDTIENISDRVYARVKHR